VITYKAEYEVGQEPALCKEIEMADSTEVCTHLTLSNKTELENFTNEQIFEHISNYLLYVKELSNDLYLYPVEEHYSHFVPVHNYNKIEQAMRSIVEWLEFVLYRDMAPMEGHTHSDDDGHTHDPDTGEEVPS
jgi:hypothetical protein